MGKNFTHQLSKNGVLNEHNLQACFQFNATTGEYVYANAKGTVLIDVDSPRVRQQVRSDKICIDMGYSIDGDPRKDWKFILGSTVLIIQTVALRGDLTKINLALNECAIVTNDPNFHTCLWLDYKAHGKTLYYDFTTLNTSVSAWMMDEVGRKLNSYDPSALDVRITETENRVTSAEEKITAAESNITELQGKVTTSENKIEDLEDKTIGFTRNNTEGKTLFTDIVVGSNDLLVTGDVRFKGPLSVTEALTSVHDFKVTGNIEGALKDANGFRYEKVRRGTIINNNGYTNLKINIYDNNICSLSGRFIESYAQDVIAGNISATITKLTPCIIDSIENILLIDEGVLKFSAAYIKNTDANPVSFNIVYRNITNINQNTMGYKLSFIINCIKSNLSDVIF